MGLKTGIILWFCGFEYMLLTAAKLRKAISQTRLSQALCALFTMLRQVCV